MLWFVQLLRYTMNYSWHDFGRFWSYHPPVLMWCPECIVRIFVRVYIYVLCEFLPNWAHSGLYGWDFANRSTVCEAGFWQAGLIGGRLLGITVGTQAKWCVRTAVRRAERNLDKNERNISPEGPTRNQYNKAIKRKSLMTDCRTDTPCQLCFLTRLGSVMVMETNNWFSKYPFDYTVLVKEQG